MMFDGNFTGEPRGGHRGVIVRKKAPGAATAVPAGFGKRTSSKGSQGFYMSHTQEVVMAGPFPNVRVYMTDKGAAQVRKWTDIRMCGILKLVMVANPDVPIVNVRMLGTDPAHAERGIIMEHELPTNFNLNSALNPTFSAIQIMNGEFLGFVFANQ